MPISAAANKNIKCFFCDDVPTDTFCMFDNTEYNNNPFMEQIVGHIGKTQSYAANVTLSSMGNLSSTVWYL